MICCILAELCYQEPAGGEVVGSAALTGAGPGEVPQLQHETAQQAEAGAGEVGESEAQQQTGELSVPKPETQNDPFFSHVVVQSYLVRLKRITGAAARFVSKVKPSRTERQTSLVVLPPPPPTSAKTEPSDISRTSAPLTVLNWTVITRSTTDDGKTRWKEGLGTNYV